MKGNDYSTIMNKSKITARPMNDPKNVLNVKHKLRIDLDKFDLNL